MKKIRKVNTKKRKKERKDAQERLATQASLMMKHPKECCLCDKLFERNHETVKTWQVTITEERVRLTCPECWTLLTKLLENEE